MELFHNQKLAVQTSIENDFHSGIHFHATGTGKSVIALTLIIEFNKKYPKKNILWICERKSILSEQFHYETLKKKGYDDIFKMFHIINFTEHKNPNWYYSVNVSKFWNKPCLIIMNRGFLTYGDKYKRLNISLDLIIHDECHSISNKTSQEFYTWLRKSNPTCNCLGFTATPNIDYNPFTNILSQYSIYEAVRDKVVLPPKIQWITPLVNINNGMSRLDVLTIVKYCIRNLPYKKILIWAGMIEYCKQLAKFWSQHLKDYTICLDTSESLDSNLYGYETFLKVEEKAIMFCACKHREGSDIPNLDGCVFLDFVSNRDSKLFTQSIGRVLRKDKLSKKNMGLMIDFNAKSAINISERLNKYLMLPKGLYPWKSKERKIKIDNTYKYKVHTLQFDLEPKPQSVNTQTELVEYSINDIINRFVRKIPDDDIYRSRLEKELQLISEKKLECYLIQAMDILNMTKDIPHVTRGSCGSSLVCYLLGISHVDPVRYNIKFARFLNEFRDTLPDIDFDFPYNVRDSVFLEIEKKWPGKMARISNHVYYHEKSALRQAIRDEGINTFISKHEINTFIKKLPQNTQSNIKKKTKELMDTFKGYSLHCGGIVFYPDGVPDDLKIKDNSILSQISHNKVSISKEKRFKIDILSSRGLAQLQDIYEGQDIDFDSNSNDKQTSELLCKGDNIGITLAESPLIRKAFIQVQPKNIEEVAICLSLIRPAAKDARECDEVGDMKESVIFDDDAIDVISSVLNCNEATADKYRRILSKSKLSITKELSKHVYLTPNQLIDCSNKLNNIRKYGFCKSHAYSYAQLVWQLAYAKTHYPKKFWKSTLQHCKSSYKTWVHLYESKLCQVDKLKYRTLSIYANARQKSFDNISQQEQMIKFGYWNMNDGNFYPNCYYYNKDDTYYFKGLVASSRVIKLKDNKHMTTMFLGVGPKTYIELSITIPFNYNKSKFGIEGTGKMIDNRFKTIQVKTCMSF